MKKKEFMWKTTYNTLILITGGKIIMKKRIVAILLVGVMAVAMLAGCGGNAEEEAPAAPTSAACPM